MLSRVDVWLQEDGALALPPAVSDLATFPSMPRQTDIRMTSWYA
jgi:hypothetical protein